MLNVKLFRKTPEDLIEHIRKKRQESRAMNYGTTVHIYQNRREPALSALVSHKGRDDALLDEMGFDYWNSFALPGVCPPALRVVGGLAHSTDAGADSDQT